jgi:hypothetical protein
MLAEAQVAVDEGSAYGRECVGASVFIHQAALAQEFVDGARGDFGEERAADIGPAIAAFGGAAADEDGTRRA